MNSETYKKGLYTMKYTNTYLEQIHKFNKDRSSIKDYDVFEYMYALRLGLVHWSDLPPDFDKYFDIPHKMDYGVDLFDLQYTKACQVKKYEGTTITWSHLCKFVTYSRDVMNCGNMILATTNTAKIDKLGQKKLIDSGKVDLIRNDFEDMLKDFLKYKVNIVEKKVVTEIEERKYLLECYNEIISSEKDVVKNQLPCGTGKTFIMLYTIKKELEKDGDYKFIVLVPWLDLAYQTLKLFKQFGLKCVFVGNRKTKVSGDYNVIICVNPSVKHISEDIDFRYLFIDEAHHLENEESKIMEKVEKLDYGKKILFSATYHETDDVDYNYSLGDAVEDGYISDYVLHFQYYTDGDRMNAIMSMIKDRPKYYPMFVYFNSTKRSKKFYDKLIAVNIKAAYLDGKTSRSDRNKVKKGLENGTIEIVLLCGVYNEGISIDRIRTVVFGDLRHSDINRIQIMMRACRLHDSKPFYRVIIPMNDTDLESNDMSDIIKTLYKVDTRMVDSVNRKSTTRIRVDGIDETDMEKAELIYENVYNRMGELIEGKGLWDMKYDLLKEYVEENDKLTTIGTVYKNVQLGRWVNTQRQDYKSDKISKERIDLLNQIKYFTWIIDYDKLWLDRYELLVEYINKFKKYPVRGSGSLYKGINIAGWIQEQRQKYKRKELKDERINKLNNLKGWVWNYDDIWNNNYKLLKEYINEKKELPKNSTIYKDIKIGAWCSDQRMNFKHDKLKDFKIKKLNEISIWKWKLVDNNWSDKYKCLKEFVDKYKKLPVTESKKDDNDIQLGNWISKQRADHKKGKLSEEQTEELNKINGWKWSKIEKLTFEMKYELLKEYVENNNKIPAGRKIYKECKLGNWCEWVRSCKKNNKLTKERIEMFEKIPGWFWKVDVDQIWNNTFDILKEYVNKNKLPTQKIKYKTIGIGTWINKQRSKKNKLEQWQINKLESLDGWYWKLDLDKQWNDSYNLAVEYITKYKKVPFGSTVYKNVKIGIWCELQRRNKKKGKLSKTRIDKLNLINEWVWSYDYETLWNNKYDLVVEYINKYKKLPVQTTTYKKENIGIWCNKQRVEYNKNNLSDEYTNKLNKLKDWYWSKFE